jgi:MtaA/CmuA family methyltransferase
MAETFTSSQRVQKRLRGEPVDRAPNFNIIMAYGVRHIGASLRDYYLDHRVLAEMNFAMREDFALDLYQAISDPYREACDFGLQVEFPEDALPMRRQPLINEPGDLSRLRPPDPHTGRRMSDRLEAIRLMKERSGGEIPVMGWVEGALAEANDLRGDSALLTDLYDRPDWVRELLEMCVEVEITFARAQIEAGASIIGLGDAIASQISPRMYRAFALPYQQRIFAAVHEMGALARLHICGDTTPILPLMAQSGADIIDVDWMVDFGTAAEIFSRHSLPGGASPAACGNFDPVRVVYMGTPEEVYQAAWDTLKSGGPRCFSAAGCEIPEGTSAANLRAHFQALVDFGGRTAG